MCLGALVTGAQGSVWRIHRGRQAVARRPRLGSTCKPSSQPVSSSWPPPVSTTPHQMSHFGRTEFPTQPGRRSRDGGTLFLVGFVLSLDRFLQSVFALVQAGKADKNGVPSPLRMAPILRKHWDVIYLAKPPLFVQKLVMAVLAVPARLMGDREEGTAESRPICEMGTVLLICASVGVMVWYRFVARR
jgi:hypothetical protein